MIRFFNRTALQFQADVVKMKMIYQINKLINKIELIGRNVISTTTEG
jgi:hypothetical protein